MNVRCGAETNVGLKREINQDSYGIGDASQTSRKGFLVVVCDGMGGHAAGEVASKLGVEVILERYYDAEDGDRSTLLRQAFLEANHRIYQEGQGSMGTTGVAALVYKNRLYVANVGDSRAYIIHKHKIQQITRDHSLVAEQVYAGLLTPEQARNSNYRNMITRALGYRSDVLVDTFIVNIEAGDQVLLSSDGLHGLVEDEEIAQIIGDNEPQEAVILLIAKANERGGIDNITAAIIKIDDLDATIEPEPLPESDEDETTAITEPRIIVPRRPETPDSPHHTATTRPHPTTQKKTGTPGSSQRLPTWGMIGGAVFLLAVVFLVVLYAQQPPPPGTATQQPVAHTPETAVVVAPPTRTLSPTLTTTRTLSPTLTTTRTAPSPRDNSDIHPSPQRGKPTAPTPSRTPTSTVSATNIRTMLPAIETVTPVPSPTP